MYMPRPLFCIQSVAALALSRGQSVVAVAAAFSSKHNHSDINNSSRKPPLFPGSIPIDTPTDITTCINQTGQSAPTNALLGKPAQCQCRHGFTQAYSLDPMPPTQKFKRRKPIDRLNSGLLKLTCPLLVSSVDILEDDGFMKDINRLLEKNSEGEENKWMECFDDAHKIHADARKELILGKETSDNTENDSIQILESKLGQRGAKAFLDAGVAGANPSAKNADIKCLHAWLADYLFRKVDPSEGNLIDTSTEHPIGDAIVKALNEQGVHVSGTDTCHEICSGCSRTSTADSNASISVQVPTPRNKQRRKRRQLIKHDVNDQ